MMPQQGNGQQPIYILKEGAERLSMKQAQRSNIAAAKAVAESVRSTLGPEGADKMLVDGSGSVVITNDGATILRELAADHPGAKLVIEVSETQEMECRDGTTSSVIIAGSLLEKAEDLLEQQIHQTVICRGYRKASELIKESIGDIGWDATEDDLRVVAKTSLTGKSAESAIDVLSDICIDALNAVIEEDGTANMDNIVPICFSGGQYDDSQLIKGVVIEKEKLHSDMKSELFDANVLLLTTPIEVKETTQTMNVNVTSPEQMEKFLAQEEAVIRDMCNNIIASGANVVFCQKDIDELAVHYLAKGDVLALKRVKKSTMESLKRSTKANLVSDTSEINVFEDLGTSKHIYEIQKGEHRCLVVEDKDGTSSSVTALLRGSTGHAVDELERAFDDSMGAVLLAHKTKTLISGGGSVYAHLARIVRKEGVEMGDRQGMAMEAYASALESIPRTLAENAGIDPVDAIINIRKAKNENYGISVNGDVINMKELGVIEPRKVLETAILTATEAAVMILRIDDVISMKQAPQGMPPMMG